MRDKRRIPRILHVLRLVWEDNPDWRLGQLLVNVTRRDDPFYVEDTVLLRELERTFSFSPATADPEAEPTDDASVA